MDHPNDDLKHYHLQVKYGARVYEITEVFRHSNKPRDIDTATVAGIKEQIRSKVDEVKNNMFYLTWRGKKLEPDTLKIRDIKVDGETIPLYVMKDQIEIHIGNGDDVPSIDDNHASESDDEKTDYIANWLHEKQKKEEKEKEKEEKEKEEKEKNKTTIYELQMKATVAETGAENLKRRGLVAEKNGLLEKATELLEKAKSLSEEAKGLREEVAKLKLTEGRGKKSKKNKKSKKRFVKKQKHKTKSK